MKVAMKSTESQRVKISVEWRHERSHGLVDFNWMPILRQYQGWLTRQFLASFYATRSTDQDKKTRVCDSE
ncbi:hypothetical protein T4B_10540 [Trichinella pseudospiralis]|uniref:Uncharacterized protein n=1 Tax=Trichinella pseudospiralis TaxID=6337 RepID=A0A0V1GIH8_TRIPS|nr:hypothetical protein T4B_10540 [Trichinella pseudospiralis]